MRKHKSLRHLDTQKRVTGSKQTLSFINKDGKWIIISTYNKHLLSKKIRKLKPVAEQLVLS